MLDKATLRRYRQIELEIIQLERDRLYWRTRAGKCVSNPAGEGGVNTGFTDPLPGIMDMLGDIERLLEDRLERLCSLKLEIERAIERLDGFDRLLLRSHYLEHKTWARIADETGYSWRWVVKLHEKALAKLADIPSPTAKAR